MTNIGSSAERKIITAGFIPLVDCAALVVAREKGFAEAEGIDLHLVKEVSWANIRDRINVGQFDVAHMLAAMPIAASLGVGHVQIPMIAPMTLGVGGNAVTFSTALCNELGLVPGATHDPLTVGGALAQGIAHRQTNGADVLTFGTVFPFSNHNYQLRYWMAGAGIDPDRDVRLVVIPPSFMVQNLKAGLIDGYCAGEPWNTLAADEQVGCVAFSAAEVWPRGPEKVLGMQ